MNKRQIIASERMAICQKCEHYIELTSQCKKCGCFMKIKTQMLGQKCPIDKWKREKI